jgi:hypothetical protein
MFARRMSDSLHHAEHIDAGRRTMRRWCTIYNYLHWPNYNTVVKQITCNGGKENHTKINLLLMQAEVVRACKAKFDEQLCRVYTRAVYQEYKK